MLSLLLSVAAATALPDMAVHQEGSSDMLMSIDDSGNLYELTDDGWVTLGDPCPGRGPFRLQLLRSEGMDEVVFIFVFDSGGNLFQTDGSVWTVIDNAEEAYVEPCLGSIFKFTEDSFSTMVLDASGVIYLHSTEAETYITPFDTFPRMPVRDMDVYYLDESETLIPMILGSDGRFHLYINEEWQAADMPESNLDIRRVEAIVNADTGLISLIGVDGAGNLYHSDQTGDCVPSDHPPCPGEGPWKLSKVYLAEDDMSIMCLDPHGVLHLSVYGEWTRLAEGFAAVEN
ncbi:MAG: hypothetical protein R6U39_08310 [Candidatus Aegiribacteria sp.]